MSIWSDLYDAHRGEIGLVIGNGPSLRNVPISFLESYPSFGTNRIYLLDGFIPTYYCAMNWLVIRQSLNEINQLYTRKFILADMAHEIMDAIPVNSLPEQQFSFNPEFGIWEGFTVTYACLQLAWWMGFEKILLVGVDHHYKIKRNHPNREVVAIEPDRNHFSPEYFGPGTRWNLPDLEHSTQAYRFAKTAYGASGREIINLGPKSKLTIFKKGKIEDYVKQNQNL